VDLTGTWRATAADEELRRRFHLPEFDADGWESLEIPGHWTDLASLRDATSVLHCHSFEHTLPPSDGGRSWLELDGITYQGDVWLDGDYLGDTEGSFIRHAFDVTDAVRDRSEHNLAIEVNCSPAGSDGKRRSLLGVQEGGNDMVAATNPGGVWAPVRLRHTGPVRLGELRAICIAADDRSATIAVRAVLETTTARSVKILTDIAGVRHDLDHSLAVGHNEVEWSIEVPDPDLWWPRHLGDQPLYELDVRVETRTGEVSDQHGLRIGLRTVKVRRWQFQLNGEQFFIKGINTGPVHAHAAKITAEAIDTRLGLAADAGFNLVRPYAHVAPDLFYDRADELGLLVWQDLPLHGPASTGLRGQAVRQATKMVSQLGHHPSIAVWNSHVSPAPEVMEAAVPTARRRAERFVSHQLPTWTKSVLDRSIKRVFDDQDGSRHSCGFTGVLPHLPRLDASATHLWFGWRRGTERDLPDFAARWPSQVRFVAEFGAQSIPRDPEFIDVRHFPSLEHMGVRADPAFEASSFERYVPLDGHDAMDQWIEATQLYQAGLLRRQIESLRRLKYQPSGGFCVHHLADAEPGVSAALVGHDGRPKLAYKAVADACRPVIVVADRPPARLAPGDAIALDIHVVNDLRHDWADAVVDAEITWPGGEHQWRFGGMVDADAVTRIGTLSWMVPDAPGLMTLTLRLSGEHEAVNRYDATIR
jgi:beta-mannosidase